MTPRKTKQKKVIADALEEAARPMSPLEILEVAQQKVPRLSIATVYRVLKGLVDEGELVPVPVPGQPDRYETHIRAAHHHHHFHCDSCHRVFDVPGCGLRVEAHLPGGFTLSRHEVMLYGSCGQCVSSGA